MRRISASALPAVLAALTAAQTLSAQQPSAPPGFAVSTVLSERSQPWAVRGAAGDPAATTFWIGLGRTVFHRPDPWTWITVHQFAAPDDLGILLQPTAGSHAWFAGLRSGTFFAIDPANPATPAHSFAGVANAFDLAIASTGEVLVSANPAWPAAGAATGVWHIGPQRTPRELLRLAGPSGPLLFDAQDRLIVADLGAAWPIPPGGVRLLRFTAARWRPVLAGGGTLQPGDAERIGAGWNGAYDLATDDGGELWVTDGNTGAVRRAHPATLQPLPTADFAMAGTALQIAWRPGSDAPFLPFQPGERAGALLVADSDFVSEHALRRLHPERPTLALWPGATFGAGTGRADLTGAGGGIALLALSTGPARPETALAWLDGAPLWSALDPQAPLATAFVALDAQGHGSVPLRHPGGFALRLLLQAAVLSPTGHGHGTSAAVTLDLLP